MLMINKRKGRYVREIFLIQQEQMGSGTHVVLGWENRYLKPSNAGKAEHVCTDADRWVELGVAVCGRFVLVAFIFLVVTLSYTSRSLFSDISFI